MKRFEDVIKNTKITMGKAIAEYEKYIDAKVEAYEEKFVELIESVVYDYFKVKKEDKTTYVDWCKTRNRIVMTRGFLSLFEDSLTAYMAVYTGLQLMMECFNYGKAPYLQIFSYKDSTYWVMHEEHGVTVLLPNEY